jgi:hypothetical protein
LESVYSGLLFHLKYEKKDVYLILELEPFIGGGYETGVWAHLDLNTILCLLNSQSKKDSLISFLLLILNES